MKKELDGRKLSHKTLEEIRIRAVKAVESGQSPETVIQSLGLSRQRIYVWLAAYREGGLEALKAEELFGRPPKLAGAEIFFADEAGIRPDYHSGTAWAPIGQTPVFQTLYVIYFLRRLFNMHMKCNHTYNRLSNFGALKYLLLRANSILHLLQKNYIILLTGRCHSLHLAL